MFTTRLKGILVVDEIRDRPKLFGLPELPTSYHAKNTQAAAVAILHNFDFCRHSALPINVPALFVVLGRRTFIFAQLEVRLSILVFGRALWESRRWDTCL